MTAFSTFTTANFPYSESDANHISGRTYNGQLFFPDAGYRDRYNTTMFDKALYWGCSMNQMLHDDFHSGYSFSFTADYIFNSNTFSPEYVMPVRPVAY